MISCMQLDAIRAPVGCMQPHRYNRSTVRPKPPNFRPRTGRSIEESVKKSDGRIELACVDVEAGLGYGSHANRHRWTWGGAEGGREAHDGHGNGCVAGLGNRG